MLAEETKKVNDLYQGTLNKEYLPVDGLASFVTLAREVMFGEKAKELEGKIATVQCLSGTGGLRVGFDFLKRFRPAEVLVSKPTW